MKRSLHGTPVAVKAGEVYRAKAKRGFRVIVVDSIRGLTTHFPYALAHEVLPSGARAHGLSRLGLPRGRAIVITLTRANGELALNHGYERVGEEARS